MIRENMVYTTMFHSFSSVVLDTLTDAVIGTLTDVMVGVLVGVGMLNDVETLVWDSAVTTLEVFEPVSYAVDALIGDSRLDAFTAAAVYSDDVRIVSASGISDDMLTGVDANVLAAVMSALRFGLPTPLADSVPFC